MESETRKPIICIDLDGCVLSYKKGWCGENIFGKPIIGVDEYLWRLRKDGWHVIVYSCRGDRKKVENILKKYHIEKGIHYDAINRRKNVIPGTYKGKIGADIYIDDRAICFRGDWKDTYKKIKNFRIWERCEK